MRTIETHLLDVPPAEASSCAVIGIDIGQKRDPTAIVVAETELRRTTRPESEPNRFESHFLVRFLERLALGSPYPLIAQRLGEIWLRVARRSGKEPQVFVDATGVGAPIVDLLRAQIPTAKIWAVTFTHGRRRLEHPGVGKVTLGKAFLVNRLQSLLEHQRLHLPNDAEARALAAELLAYEIRVDVNANDKYGAFRVGTHDDLVTAVGLAVQREPAAGF